jgi:hypothetical protein
VRMAREKFSEDLRVKIPPTLKQALEADAARRKQVVSTVARDILVAYYAARETEAPDMPNAYTWADAFRG